MYQEHHTFYTWDTEERARWGLWAEVWPIYLYQHYSYMDTLQQSGPIIIALKSQTLKKKTKLFLKRDLKILYFWGSTNLNFCYFSYWHKLTY
jgi:hypothetical protein